LEEKIFYTYIYLDHRKKGNILSDHQKMILSEINKNNTYSAKKYNLVFPDGSVKEIFNMAKFCRDNNLCTSSMSQLSKGLINSYRGYQINQSEVI